MRRIGVTAECSPDAVEFVGGDSSTDATTTDEYSDLGGAVLHSFADLFCVVRIIVRNRAVVRAEVDQIVTSLAQLFNDPFVERITPMICSNRDSHLVISARACWRTLSRLNPRFFSATSPGADAPNRSKQITSPCGPTYRSHPCRTPASTASRAVTDGNKTSSRYSCDCSSNNSQHGMDTTRAATPSSCSFCHASRTSETSDPVASKITCGFSASANTYPPRLNPSALENLFRSITATFCRVNASAVGA